MSSDFLIARLPDWAGPTGHLQGRIHMLRRPTRAVRARIIILSCERIENEECRRRQFLRFVNYSGNLMAITKICLSSSREVGEEVDKIPD